MKTNLFLSITLFLGGALLSAQAQDFRALPPSEQPNAAELAYFGGKNPNSPGNNADAATATTSFSTTSTFRYMPAIQCFGNRRFRRSGKDDASGGVQTQFLCTPQQ